MRLPVTSLFLMAYRLGSVASSLDLRTALFWRVAGTFLLPSLDFFATLLTDLTDGVDSGSKALGARKISLLVYPGVTNLGIFPDNDCPSRGTGQGAVTNGLL